MKTLTTKIIWYFFKPYKLKVGILLILTGISGFLEALNLAALYPVMHNGLNLGNESNRMVLNVINFVISTLRFDNKFAAACTFLIIVSITAIAFRIVYFYFSNKLMIHIVADTKKKVIDKFIEADYNFYVKNQQGKLIHTGSVAPDYTATVVLSTIRLLYDATNSLFMFALLMLLSWQATLFLLVFGVIYGLTVKKIMQKIIYKCANLSTKADRRKNVVLNEFISGFKSIKIFAVFKEWEAKYLEAVHESLSNKFKMLMGRVYPEAIMKFMFFIVVAIAGIILSQKVPEDVLLALPLFGTFAIVASRIFPSIQLVGNSFMGISNSMPNTEIIYDLCNEKVRIIPDGSRQFKHFQDQITFKNVEFKYPNMNDAFLKGVSFSVKRNEMTALVGASGSGKTTIINLLLKLYKQDAGNIAIDGVDVFEYSNETYLSKIGFVGQDTFIFNSTIRENIRFGMNGCTDAMIIEAAKQANAHEFIEKTSNGYETIVGDAGAKLSGGQKQRIAIARAILRKPEIIILDEATSSLDNISENKIQEAINTISKYTTILVIAHRLTTVQDADKIIILENGEVKEEGRHADLLNNKNVYYKLFTAKTNVEKTKN